jgi:hypothetical protein
MERRKRSVEQHRLPHAQSRRARAAKYPRVRFAHINYVEDPRWSTIVAIARMFDAEPVVAVRDVAATVQDDLLVYDFGKPRSRGKNHRFFEHGFVAYNPRQPLRVRSIVVPPRSAHIVRRDR